MQITISVPRFRENEEGQSVVQGVQAQRGQAQQYQWAPQAAPAAQNGQGGAAQQSTGAAQQPPYPNQPPRLPASENSPPEVLSSKHIQSCILSGTQSVGLRISAQGCNAHQPITPGNLRSATQELPHCHGGAFAQAETPHAKLLQAQLFETEGASGHPGIQL